MKLKRHLPQAAKHPKCGTCTACCTALGVRELEKKPYERCRHVLDGEGHGCGIYTARPASCREYRCLWLMGGVQADARPDRCGLIFEPHPERADTIVVREVVPGAIDRSGYLFQSVEDRFILILSSVDGRKTLRGPKHMMKDIAGITVIDG